MRSFSVRCLLFCLLLGVVLSTSSCTVMLSDHHTRGHTVSPAHAGGPPAHAPAHGVRHSYVYYPSSYVYFDTTRKVYFHIDSGAWRMSISLPSSIIINSSAGVSVVLDTDRPYRHFATHKKNYPPGQLRKRHTVRTKKEQPPGKYRQPPKQARRQPQPDKYRQPPKQARRQPQPGKYRQPPKQAKKQPPGQTRKKDKETGKDEGEDKGKDKKK